MSLFTAHTLVKTFFPLLLGAFSVLGFAPFYFYPASVLSLIGLFYLWLSSDTPKQAAITGFFYGLGMFGTGIYWIFISLYTYGGMPSLIAVFSTLTLSAFLALFPAIVGALSKRISSNQQNMMLIAAPTFWALSDWVRSWIFTGFPWLTTGYSQVPDGPLAGYVPIFGVYGVSFLIGLIASLIAGWLTKKSFPAISRFNATTAILVIMCIVVGEALKHTELVRPTGKPISVSLLQGNIAQDLKWNPEVAIQTISQYLTMVESSQAKLIVLPETALPILSNELPDEIKSRLQQHAIKKQGGILVGLVERENGKYFNSVLSFSSAPGATYRKSHLVPFGEFIPLKTVFGWVYRDLLNMPLSDLSRGNRYQHPMQIAGEKVAVNICYEDVFGEEIIRQLPEATLIVNATNDAWYGDSFAADQHMQFSQARALETGRMVLRATNTGATAIIDTKGHVIAHAPHFTQTTLNGFVQGYTGSTLYVYWGNWPFIFFSFGLILFLWRRNTIATN